MGAQKSGTITIGILIAAIIIALIAADFLYFIPAEKLDQDTQAENLQIIGSQNQFKEIQDKLLANDKFQSLEKIGTYPVSIDTVKKGDKNNPFIEAPKQ